MSEHFGDKGDATIFSHQAPKHQTMPTIKSLIEDSRLREALKALEKLVPDLQNDVTFQLSRLSGLERQENNNLVTRENADIERARIRGAILAIYADAGIKEEEPEARSGAEGRQNNGTERDIDDHFDGPFEPIDIPAIEPFEGGLTVPKGEDGKTKILFLTANPADQQNLAVDRESKQVLVDAQGKELEVVVCPHIDRGSMINMVAFQKPQIVHFSGHGKDGSLAMIDPGSNKTYRIENEDLVEIFQLFKEVGVKCVVLCSCWSFSQAKVISELGIPVIGMLRKIGDEEAIQFSRDLYYLLMSNNPLESIFKLAKLKVTKASREIPSLWYNGKRIA